MQTSLVDLVARMAAALDGRPAGGVRVGGLRGSAPALCLARVLERRARPGVGTGASGGGAGAVPAHPRLFPREAPRPPPPGPPVPHLPPRAGAPPPAPSRARQTL